MKRRWEKRRRIQGLLVGHVGCAMQHTGWPCNPCFHHALGRTGLSDDEVHTMWIATLVLRGDYKSGHHGIDMPDTRLSAVVDRMLMVLPQVWHVH